MTSKSALKYIEEKMNLILDAAIILLFIPIVVGTFITVIARYVFSRTIPQLTELSTILFVWMSFFAATKVLYEERHPAFTVVVDKFPGRRKVGIKLVVWVLVTYILMVLLKGSIKLVESGLKQYTSTLGVSQAWVYASILVGTVLMLFVSIVKLLQYGSKLVGREM